MWQEVRESLELKQLTYRASITILVFVSVGCRAVPTAITCPSLSQLLIENQTIWCIDGNGGEIRPALQHKDPTVGENGLFPMGALLYVDSEGLVSTFTQIDPNSNLKASTHFYPDGRLKGYTEFESDRQGGIMRAWHENGQLKMEGVLLDVGREGPWRFWEPDGSLRVTVVYQDGTEISRTPYPAADELQAVEPNVE